MTNHLFDVPADETIVGRDAALRVVGEQLAGDRPVVLWGTGGIGKTALVIQVAHRQRSDFPAGVVWLDCHGATWQGLLDRIGIFCGIGEMGQARPKEREIALRWALLQLGGRCLLIWDHADDLEESEQLHEFAGNLPDNCQALLVRRADPPQATWPGVELQPLSDETMAEWYLQLAAADPSIPASRPGRDFLPRLFAPLCGVPLALKLVVPLVKEQGHEAISQQLRQGPAAGIEAAFALSYANLGAVERRLLTRLSVFSRPFLPDAAEAVLPDGEGIGAALENLQARALIARDGARFSFHARLRQCAYDQLCAEQDPRPVHRLAAEYLQGRIHDPNLGSTPAEALQEVDQWAQAGACEQLARRASDLLDSLDVPGHRGEIGARLGRAWACLQEQPGVSPVLKARVLAGLGTIAGEGQDWDLAADYYQQALSKLEPAGDRRAIGQTLTSLGQAYWHKPAQDRFSNFKQQLQAIKFLQRALATMDQEGDPRATAQIYNDLGSFHQFLMKEDEAIECHQQALGVLEQLGDLAGVARTYSYLGRVYRYKREPERAVAFDEKALALQEQLADLHGAARTLIHLGVVYRQEEDLDRAIEYFERAARMMEKAEDSYERIYLYSDLNWAWKSKGMWEQAFEFHRQHLARSQQAGDLRGVARAYYNLGQVYDLKNKGTQAIEYYEKNLSLCTRAGDLWAMARACTGLSSACWRNGDRERAIELDKKFLALSERLGDLRAMADTLTYLGQAYAQQGEEQQAIACQEQSLVIAEKLGWKGSVVPQHQLLSELHRKAGRIEEAKLHSALATLALVRRDSVTQIYAFKHLAELCGSEEAAKAYLEEVADANPPPDTSPDTPPIV